MRADQVLFKRHIDGGTIIASLKETSVSLSIEGLYVASWDLGGRLYSAWRSGQTWRRGLNGQVLHKRRDPEPADRNAVGAYDARQRTKLGLEEAAPLVDEAAAFAGRVVQAMREAPAEWLFTEPQAKLDSLLMRLETCSRFGAEEAREDAAAFSRIYRPIGVLPPDQYLSVVLQATEGCSFGTCTFCDLYHDGYRVKTPGEFEDHVRQVVRYLGDSILLRRRSIFLGAANALAIPMPRLVRLMEGLRRNFPAPVPPIRAFVDAFTGVRKDSVDYGRLRELGLDRVYVGLESGHDPLLSFVRKPGNSGEAVATVRAIKSSGVNVGVIVMIGLGGSAFAEGHVTDTAAALEAMKLGPADLLYFSDLVEMPGTPYPVIASQADLQPLDLAARLAQLRAIRSRLVFDGRGPQVARYDVREFIY